MKVKSLSCVRLFATAWTTAYQALSSMGFSRQEYWSGVPLPSLHVSFRTMFFSGYMPRSGIALQVYLQYLGHGRNPGHGMKLNVHQRRHG